MNKGVLLHLENDKKLLQGYKKTFESLEIDLEFIPCLSIQDFNAAAEKHKGTIKSIIFDLVGDKATNEELGGNPEFLSVIKSNFADYNLPIFIYSARLDLVEDEFINNGTVLKLPKDDSIKIIFDKIKLYLDSGFIDVFSPGGLLETQLHKDLHSAFIQQFKNNSQIVSIIELIKSNSDEQEYPHRVMRVFKRIAVRSLLTEMLSPEVDEKGNIKEEFVGITEHYVQRINKIQIWTGDIFKNKRNDERIFILMPRCNALRSDEYLVCPFILGAKPEGMKADKYDKLLTGDPIVSGYDRFLPTSPVYEGGKVALSKFSMKPKDEILDSFHREISLSDELTNEILGKFASYFFRTGITPWNPKEGKEEYKAEKSADK